MAYCYAEAEEEVGLAPSAVHRVMRLDDLVTVTGYHMATMLAVIPPGTELVANEREVTRIFHLPIEILAMLGNGKRRQRPGRACRWRCRSSGTMTNTSGEQQLTSLDTCQPFAR